MRASRQLVDAICAILEDPTEQWEMDKYMSHFSSFSFENIYKPCITQKSSNLSLNMRGHIRGPVEMSVNWWQRFRVRRSIAVAQEHVVRRSIKTMLPADILKKEMGLV